MPEYEIKVEAKLKARNFESAEKKLKALVSRIERGGIDWCHIKLEPKE